MIATTIAGSLPKPAWLAEPEKLWAPWRLEGAALTEGQQDAALAWLKIQDEAGIDIQSDGGSAPTAAWPRSPARRRGQAPRPRRRGRDHPPRARRQMTPSPLLR